MRAIDKKHKALLEVRVFLAHIQPRVGEQAFNYIYSIVETAISSGTHVYKLKQKVK